MTDNLVLEILKQIQAEQADFRGDLANVAKSVFGVEHDVLLLRADLATVKGDLNAIKNRLDRIERRLDLVNDTPTN